MKPELITSSEEESEEEEECEEDEESEEESEESEELLPAPALMPTAKRKAAAASATSKEKYEVQYYVAVLVGNVSPTFLPKPWAVLRRRSSGQVFRTGACKTVVHQRSCPELVQNYVAVLVGNASPTSLELGWAAWRISVKARLGAPAERL